MLVINANGKEYKVKFGYEATLKTKLLSRVSKLAKKSDGEDLESAEELLLFLPEMLLVGLQKYHRDEYGFNYETGEGKEKYLPEMYDILDSYCDENDDGVMGLFEKLQDELTNESFLAGKFRKKKSQTPELTVLEAPEELENEPQN